jgi:hypothetical protein
MSIEETYTSTYGFLLTEQKKSRSTSTQTTTENGIRKPYNKHGRCCETQRSHPSLLSLDVEIAQNAHVFAQQPGSYPKATTACRERVTLPQDITIPQLSPCFFDGGCHVRHNEYIAITCESKATAGLCQSKETIYAAVDGDCREVLQCLLIAAVTSTHSSDTLEMLSCTLSPSLEIFTNTDS